MLAFCSQMMGMTMTSDIERVINADDFGISLGVNQAILNGYQHGILTGASLMVNARYTPQALQFLKKMPNLKVGVHLTLTSQRNHHPLLTHQEVPLIVGGDGQYRCEFLKLLWISIVKKKELKRQVKKEFQAQIEKALAMGITIDHLDSHRHVHMIPALFSVTKALKQAYHIPHLRVINENAYLTLKTTGQWQHVFSSGMIKWGLLKFFRFLNKTRGDTYFYSILYTMRIFGKATRDIKIPKKYKRVEINIHPSVIKVDKANYTESLDDYLLLHPNRQREYETMLSPDLLKKIHF